MAALSDYLENKLIDHLLRATPYTAPSKTYVALLTAVLDDTGGGTEVSGDGYARVEITSGTGAWTATQGGTSGASSGTGGMTTNASTISFPTPSASWGTVTHFGLYDAATGGNLLLYGALTSSKVINEGDSVSFAAGALSFQIDN